MKLILIGNYQPDGQESMQRFAQMLSEGVQQKGISVDCWRPKAIVGRPFASTNAGVGKWAGYVDKWILFPLYLRLRRLFLNNKKTRFHICDHSNAPYLKHLPKQTTAITCHDVIAVRAGLGYAGTYVSASKMGKLLQQWILQNLRAAQHLAAVSRLTLEQLKELTHPAEEAKNWRVVHNGFNAPFFPLDKTECTATMAKAGLHGGEAFILHVGSDLPRKNRKLLLEMVATLGSQWTGKICFAGKALEPEMWQHAKRLELEKRIVSVVKPDHQTLQALYTMCEAFIFPSFSEGFGWPVIEAQACGAPVIASNIEPMPEIGGEAALFADPAKPETFSRAFLRLQEKGIREEMIQKGFCNVRRFQPEMMIQEYLKIHGLAAYVSESN